MDEQIYQEALVFLKTIDELEGVYPSAATFQSRLKTSASLTKQIVERMEIEGFISEFNGRGPRKILRTVISAQSLYGYWGVCYETPEGLKISKVYRTYEDALQVASFDTHDTQVQHVVKRVEITG